MITQLEIARALGVSKGQVSKMKARGMPVDSEAAALAWRDEHWTSQGSRELDSEAALDAAKKLLANSAPPAAKEASANDDPEAVLERLRDNERQAYVLLNATTQRAIESQKSADAGAIPGIMRIYLQSVNNRLEAERKWEKHRIKIGQLVTVEFAQGLITKAFSPIQAQLAQLPKIVAANANPANPQIAERAVEKALGSLYAQVGAALAEAPKA